MKIEDILRALPSKEDIANAVGLEARSSATGDMLTAFAIFGTGMILGAGLALLFAPKAGREMRHDIAEKVGEIGEHLRAQAPQPAAAANSPSAAEQTSFTKPGRAPPSTVSLVSSTRIERPVRANEIAAANPSGPAPTTTAPARVTAR